MSRRKVTKSSCVKIGVAAALVLLAFFGYKWLESNRIGAFEESGEVYVHPGDSLETVLAQLPECRFSRMSLKNALEGERVAERLKPGHYTVTEKTTLVALARMLANGWQTPVNVTLSGSLRSYGEIASRLSAQLMVSREEVLEAFSDSELLARYGFTPGTAFALIIPDTYSMWWTSSVEDIFSKMKSAYGAFWTSQRIARAKQLHLSPMQVSIVASIVRSESNCEAEYPKIAGVYLNRLRSGQRLQADPTVAFIYDYKLDRVLKRHLQTESPYNTYRHKGLPPGPICSPSKAALEAVLAADTASGNMFFCASPDLDGTHVFCRTYEEHLRNARAFQKALDARSKN